MTPEQRIKQELGEHLRNAEYVKQKAAETIAEADKRIEELRRQIECDHEWVSDGSGMQLSTYHCPKCGALDAV